MNAQDTPGAEADGSFVGTMAYRLSVELASFAGEGEEVAADGKHPFVLDDPASFWLVEEGKVEIFTVALADGRQSGARNHFLTVEPGQGLFGMEIDETLGSTFLAVGKVGTRLRRIGVERLRDMAFDPRFTEQIVALVDGWVNGLSKSLTRDTPAPRIEANLRAAEKVTLEKKQKARSGKGVLWLTTRGGDLLFADLAALSPEATGALVPLSPYTWIEAAGLGEEIRIEARRAVHVVGEAGYWRGLESFHRALCECELLNKQLLTVDLWNQLKSKAEYSRAAVGEAVRDLASVLTAPAAEPRETRSADDPLLAAARHVGAALDVEIRSHPEAKDKPYEDRLAVYAKASRVRLRQIALRDDWWKRDQGPILARREGSERAVALLPRGAGAYVAFDPESGERETVSEELASTLAPFGHVLYRPFPVGPVSALGLARFGARGLKKDVLLLVAMGIGVGLLGALTPYFTGKVFDAAIPQAEKGLLLQFCLALFVGAVTSAAFKIVQGVAVLRIQGKMDYSIQAAVWDRLLNLPSSFFRSYAAGDLADRAAGVNAIRGLLAGAGITAILGSVSSVFYVALLFVYSLPLAFLAIVLTLVFVGFTTVANYLQLTLKRGEMTLRGKISGLVLQLISGVSKLRVAGAENHALRIWARQFAAQRSLSTRSGRVQNAVAVFNSAFPIFASMAIFYAVVRVQSGGGGSMTTGQFIGFSAAFSFFLTAMQALSDASLGLLEAIPIYERLKPIVTTEPEVDERRAYPGRLSGEIEISHVHFRYQQDGPWILKDVVLDIQPGEMVAFVGASGSGKSTLMRLLLGFERPEKGSIYYDGQDLATLDLREVRQQMGVVLQESRLLPADIYRNIVGTSSLTVDDAWEAAAMAGLDQDVAMMPMGMHTYLGEGGGGLSGGQKQRLLIARALVHKPRILFFDEATSALDNRTQAVVTESLERLQATRIVIAHRLSTVMGADRICYIESGSIREMGTYEELMERDGLFAQLARRQMA